MFARVLARRFAAHASRPSLNRSRTLLSRSSPCPTALQEDRLPSKLSSLPIRLYATSKSTSRKTKPAASRSKPRPKGSGAPRLPRAKKSKPRATKSKKATRKASPKRKSKTKRPKRKAATPLEKAKAQVVVLKNKALLDAPKRLPESGYQNFFYMNKLSVGKENASRYKSLPRTEAERYTSLAAQNKVANKQEYQNWVQSHTVDEIRIANNARSRLRLIRKRPLPAGRRIPLCSIYPKIPDDRQLKRPSSPFILWTTERRASSEFSGVRATEVTKALTREWKSKSAGDVKAYRDRADVQRAQYYEQAKAMYPSRKFGRTKGTS